MNEDVTLSEAIFNTIIDVIIGIGKIWAAIWILKKLGLHP